jgi:predicted dehydrogenase
MNSSENNPLDRRDFITRSTAALAAASVVGFPAIMHAQTAVKPIRIALVGCGGRGTGAAGQALNAGGDVQLVALGDVFADRLETAYQNFKNGDYAARVLVDDAHKFVGLDAIDKICALPEVDVVLLTTPPGFRPEHLQKCVDAGKHTFCEKPCATDAAGVQRFLAATKAAKEKGLGLLSGFCYRFAAGERDFFRRVHAGEIGDVRAVYGSYMGGSPWVKKRKEEWSDLEYQLRNWMYFTWLSGDHLVEQAIHSVDKMLWSFNDATPVRAWSLAGRQQRTEEEYGHVFDHFAVGYEFSGGRMGTIFCRQQQNTWGNSGEKLFGTKGTGEIVAFTSQSYQLLDGTKWKYNGPKPDMYQNEHNEFFASLRTGQPLNMGEQLAHSTMVGIMGRMAGYTGQVVTWDEAVNAKEDLRPTEPLDWKMKLPTPPVAIPGRTKIS